MQSLGLYRKQIRLLERFHQRCLHSILGIKWQDHASNEEVLKRVSLPSIECILLQMHLRWAGHVTRVEDVRMPKSSLLQRSPRRKARSWSTKKALQRSAEETGGNQPSVMAADQNSWRSSVRTASCELEAERHKAAKEKRRRQKWRASHSSSSQTFVCPKCGRGCASRIGLYSQRACKN